MCHVCAIGYANAVQRSSASAAAVHAAVALAYGGAHKLGVRVATVPGAVQLTDEPGGG
jgi:hypothetical protein